MLRSSTANFFDQLEEILNLERDARSRTEESCFGDEVLFNPFVEPTEDLIPQQEAQAPIPEFSLDDLRVEPEFSLFTNEIFSEDWDNVNATEPTEDLTFLAELQELKALESHVDGDLHSEPEVHLDLVDLMQKPSAVVPQMPEDVLVELNESRKRNARKQEDIVDAKTGELIDEAELYHKNKKAITYDAFLKRHYRFVETGVPLTRDQKREIHHVDGDFYFRGKKVVRARKEYNKVTSHSTYGRLFAHSVQSNPDAKSERILVRLKK